MGQHKDKDGQRRMSGLAQGVQLGYCTNVHAGHDLTATLSNLDLHAAGVRRELEMTQKLGVGLWLAAEAAEEARTRTEMIRERLDAAGLRVFTLNGFPYSNFHEAVVKHRVYEPDWADPARLAYTLDLIEVLDGILDDGAEGSISTLPIGWPGAPCAPVNLDTAADHLHRVARHLANLEAQTGRLIHVDLEPEPGCIFDQSADMVRFWNESLLRGRGASEHMLRRYLRVCHDVCHASVVFEDQADAFAKYAGAGILVGKVQVSSSLCMDLRGSDAARRGEAIDELRQFREPRYLHQTRVRTGERVRAFEDLPEAFEAAAREPGLTRDAEWRVHFHVPIHLERVGLLGTSQDQIEPALGLALAAGVRHFEVETYAWTVLPEELRAMNLAAGIAEELRWAEPRLHAAASAPADIRTPGTTP